MELKVPTITITIKIRMKAESSYFMISNTELIISAVVVIAIERILWLTIEATAFPVS